MRDDLQYNPCNGCGEISPEGQGIISMVNHCCPLNQVTYRPGSFRLRHLSILFGGRDTMVSFKDILVFPHFRKMNIPETGTLDNWIDRNSYSLARDLEIKQMKRLRAYINLEEEFDSKY